MPPDAPLPPTPPSAAPAGLHVHLLSDSTGHTVGSTARAALALFETGGAREHHWILVRSRADLDRAMEGIRRDPGPVFFTLFDPELRRALEAAAPGRPWPLVPVLDAVVHRLSPALERARSRGPGRQYALDADYFRRIDAMHFAVEMDDGRHPERLAEADVVLAGVSRSSKTPTSLYLANFGLKAANVPIVPGAPLPPALEQAAPGGRPLVVGLTHDARALSAVRRVRLEGMAGAGGAAPRVEGYADAEQVRAELREANRLFARRGWPVIDVTRRSIEETAAAVVSLLPPGSGPATMAPGVPTRLAPAVKDDAPQALPPQGAAGASERPPSKAPPQGAAGASERPPSKAPPQGAAGASECPPSKAPPQGVVLASASPARRRLLEEAGVALAGVDPSGVDEESVLASLRAEGAGAAEAAEALALLKARAVSARRPGALVVGGDQILECEGEWIGKPASSEEALAMLLRQSGREVSLATAAVVALDGARVWGAVETPRARFHDFSEDEARAALERLGPVALSAAGACVLEGATARLVARLDGSLHAALGLPLLPLLSFLRERGA